MKAALKLRLKPKVVPRHTQEHGSIGAETGTSGCLLVPADARRCQQKTFEFEIDTPRGALLIIMVSWDI